MKKQIKWVVSLLAASVGLLTCHSCTTTESDSTVAEVAALSASGIHFRHDSWQQILEQAKQEKKLVFVDFYTQWCGPCYNMANTIFLQPEVGMFYNTHFVCAKIDTEVGEGRELAKKFNVRTYPTYAFIDPEKEQAVHMSSSRQSAEQFIYTGESALNPVRRSFYLAENYDKGNREKSFLIDYIRYYHSIFAQKKVSTAFEELMHQNNQLTDPVIWDVFVETIHQVTPYLKEVSDNYAKYCQLFGKEIVDAKFVKETQYGDLSVIESLCNFKGKEFNCEMIRINDAIYRKKDYEDAIQRIDALIADPAIDKEQLIDRLKFMTRISRYNPNELPRIWYEKCLEYLRYIAYNNPDREDSQIHYEYAMTLENLLQHLTSTKDIPASLLKEPTYGKKTYSMRPDALKMKPHNIPR